MSKTEIKIVRENVIIDYPNGKRSEFTRECDICLKPNYPVFTWQTYDDPYIQACICADCATEMMAQDAT